LIFISIRWRKFIITTTHITAGVITPDIRRRMFITGVARLPITCRDEDNCMFDYLVESFYYPGGVSSV